MLTVSLGAEFAVIVSLFPDTENLRLALFEEKL